MAWLWLLRMKWCPQTRKMTRSTWEVASIPSINSKNLASLSLQASLSRTPDIGGPVSSLGSSRGWPLWLKRHSRSEYEHGSKPQSTVFSNTFIQDLSYKSLILLSSSHFCVCQGGGPRGGDQRSDHLRCQGDGDAAAGEREQRGRNSHLVLIPQPHSDQTPHLGRNPNNNNQR